ncbi:MAG: preprotein translocase subunit SecE [Parcubacteria group bacterium]|nr:preprotein translocase subunit SecE [Parcubacteria group bacterium]
MTKIFRKIKTYFEESWRELKKVNWPTRYETKNRTLGVLALAFFIAIILTIVDYGLIRLMGLIIK